MKKTLLWIFLFILLALLASVRAHGATSSLRISHLIDWEFGVNAQNAEADTNALSQNTRTAPSNLGVWTTNLAGGSGHITISTDMDVPLLRPIILTNLEGNVYTGASDTRSLKMDDTTKNETLIYTLKATAAKASAGFFFNANNWTQDNLVYDVFAMENTSASDFASVSFTNRTTFDVVVRTAAGASTHISLTKNKTYWITVKYDAAGTLATLKAYDPVTWLVMGTVTKAIANSNCKLIAIGRYDNNQNAPASSVHYTDDVMLDDTGNNYPLFPANAWVADSNSRTDLSTVHTSARGGAIAGFGLGDAIVLPAGSNSYTTEFDITKQGVTISGVSSNTCCITNNTGGAGSGNPTLNVTSGGGWVTFSNLMVLGTNYGHVAGGNAGRGIEFDQPNCRAKNIHFVNLLVGSFTADNPPTCVWNSTYLNCQYMNRVFGKSDGSPAWTTLEAWPRVDYGGTNFAVVENCQYTIQPGMLNDTVAMFTTQQGQRWICRRCTFSIQTNYDFSPIWDSHGPTSGGPLRGAMGAIVTSNFVDFIGAGSSADPVVDIRGGSMLFFNNVITNYASGAGIQLRIHDGDAELYDQNNGWEHHTNIFCWSNTMNGASMPWTFTTNTHPATNICNPCTVPGFSSRIATNVTYFGTPPDFYPWEPPWPFPLRDDAQPVLIVPVRGRAL